MLPVTAGRATLVGSRATLANRRATVAAAGATATFAAAARVASGATVVIEAATPGASLGPGIQHGHVRAFVIVRIARDDRESVLHCRRRDDEVRLRIGMAGFAPLNSILRAGSFTSSMPKRISANVTTLT